MASENSQQELMFRLSIFEQQAQQLQQQLQAVEQGVIELQSLNLSLDDIKGSNGKEIFCPIGRGIFAKAKLISEDLIVDIGQGNFVTKNVEGAKKILEEQIKKLEDAKIELQFTLQKMGEEITKIIQEAETGEKTSEGCSCGCKEGKECTCEDDCECECRHEHEKKGKKK